MKVRVVPEPNRTRNLITRTEPKPEKMLPVQTLIKITPVGALLENVLNYKLANYLHLWNKKVFQYFARQNYDNWYRKSWVDLELWPLLS